MTYDPARLTFTKVYGGAAVGYGFRLAESRLGQAQDTVRSVAVASIELTDGYEVTDGNYLSMDPLTGKASFAERFRPGSGESVIDRVTAPMAVGDRWRIDYKGAYINQGTVSRVEWHLETDGGQWVRKTAYTLVGVASAMLDSVVSWDFLDEEGALTRLQRFFATVDTTLLSAPQVTYLNGIYAPGKNEGSATLLDIARDFTSQTGFPVRTTNVFPAQANTIQVIPAVTFAGAPPTAVLGGADAWTRSADFAREAGSLQVVGADLPTNDDRFIAGVQTVTGYGRPLGQFALGASRLGQTFSQPIGIQVPAVLDLWGTRFVASKVNHSFTVKHYRSDVELTAPASIGG